MKSLNSEKPCETAPIHVFITGGTGAGKNHAIKTIYQTATKTFRHGPEDPDKPSVLLLAPTTSCSNKHRRECHKLRLGYFQKYFW